MTFMMPIQVVSEANLREHWARKAKRTKEQRWCAKFHSVHAGVHRMAPPLTVKLTRIAPRKLDSDNLARAFKAVRDGIADALGVDDGSDLVRWEYDQRKGAPRQYAVEVEVTP